MNISNVQSAPRIWQENELLDDLQKAVDDFVDRRLDEPSDLYRAHGKRHQKAVFRLFRNLRAIDFLNVNPEIVRQIILDNELYDALRYVAGPPISKDDLGVLVTRNVRGFAKTRVKKDDVLVSEILALICRLSDPVRFPWVANRSPPSRRQLREAIATTSVLRATQSIQTERRGYGKVLERKLEAKLTNLGFQRSAAPKKGKISAPADHPVFPIFFGECTVYGRKVDMFIPLRDGRMVALEAKDSSSGLNSVKRLNNDTAAKAKHFTDAGGRNIINVALISGVFKLQSLMSAQSSGLYLVWAHRTDDFLSWIEAQI